jgi:hypothetical protein
MVFATRHFVYVHVPRTGGYFVREVAQRHWPIEWTSERYPGDPRRHLHDPYETLPPRYRDLPALVFVRNPWDWYVSMWAWLTEHGGSSPMHKAAEAGFAEFVRAGTALRAARGGGYFKTFESISRGAEVRRFEGLRAELRTFLDRHAIPVTEDLEADIEAHPAVNAKEHAPYRCCYDDETRELVALESREIIERFDYEF